MNKKIKKQKPDPFDHAWKYFELHANQRISLIRYFVILFSLYITTIGYLLIRFCHSGLTEELTTIIFSMVFIALTWIFKCLDARNRDLIHLAEEALRKSEAKHNFEENDCIFTKEMEYTYKNNSIRHTQCFLRIFQIACITSWFILLFSILQILFCNTHLLSSNFFNYFNIYLCSS